MANIIQRRRGTTQEHEGFTGAEGEITIDLDKETVVVHNDVQPGGYPLAREDLSNVIDKVGVTQLNLSEGGAGMVLQTNGAGVISFTNQPDISLAVVGGDVTGTVGNIALGENTVGVYELKLSEGQNGQILQTDGAGTISFTNQPDISASAVGGDISGTVGNAQIVADAVGPTEIDTDGVEALNIRDANVTEHKLATDAVTTIKIKDINVTDDKILSMNADKLTGQLPQIDGFRVLNIDPTSHTHAPKPYDISFLAGYDIETLPVDVIEQAYGEMVMARSGTFEGDVGYIDTQCSGTPVIVDVLIDTGSGFSSIYSTRPQFPVGTSPMTSGTISTTDFASGNRVRFSVTQIGNATAGAGVRFMLKCKV